MVERLRNRHFLLLDLLLAPIAVYSCYVLRLEGFELGGFFRQAIFLALLFTVATVVIFRQNGIYARYWRYASVEELISLVSSVVIADVVTCLAATIMIWLITGLFTLPRSIPFIIPFLAVPLLASPRLAARMWRVTMARRQRTRTSEQRVLIIGAGDAGAALAAEISDASHLGLQLVGFLDDDATKQRVSIRGARVLGMRANLPDVVIRNAVDLVIIAMPSASSALVRETVELCARANVPVKTLPGLQALISGHVTVGQLRNVQIEDLLQREPVQIDATAVNALLKGKCVLVTGGGGSIGGELCRQIWRCNPAVLIVVGHGENSVFEIEQELLGNKPAAADAPKICSVIADIRFEDRVRAVFDQHKPDVVFHAAAHKHVPLMEDNPGEAISNNVLGTRNLARAAIATGVERFVMISSDKAVNPTSIMGASKRVAEFVIHDAFHGQMTEHKTLFSAVRFGNVLGSRGSVVLTFKKQIAAGGPVTITHPDITRYFMTIPEAVQLVLQAAVLGNGGEVFVLDMGKPVKIVDLARDLITLSGYKPEKEIAICYTGLRNGEKLFEELFLPGESYQRTEHAKIFIAANASTFLPADLESRLVNLLQSARESNAPAIRSELRGLIPESKLET